MNILVCLKQSIDVNQLRYNPDTLEPMLKEAPPKASDFDLNALEEALRIREKRGGKVILISAADSLKEIVVREALAMGADEAYVAVDERLKNADSLVTAQVLAGLARHLGEYDLILCGEASVDEGAYQVGPRLAEELGIPSITHAISVEVEDGVLRAARQVEDRVEVIEASLPAVVTVGMEINTPRLPTLLMIRKAKKKPLNQVRLEELGIGEGELEPAVETLEVKALRVERKRLVLEGELREVAEKLARILVEEGVVKK